MSEPKSGYQLRAELLALARDIVETNIHMARENRDNTRPKYFTTEDVISEANKLYDFVKSKQQIVFQGYLHDSPGDLYEPNHGRLERQ